MELLVDPLAERWSQIHSILYLAYANAAKKLGVEVNDSYRSNRYKDHVFRAL